MSELVERGPDHLLTAFWPAEDHHGIGHVPLDVEPPSNPDEVTPLLLRLAALSEAMRGQQTANGNSISDRAAAALKEDMADALRELAELVDEESAAPIRLRADVLAGKADEKATTRQIATEAPAPPLEVVCGALCTWRAKTRSPLHSFVAATHNEAVQQALDAYDASLEETLGELRDALDAPGLHSKCVMAMHATDMIVSGGEAAGHPKHFAYFLPQDEDVDDLPLEQQRTLYLHNVHRLRFEQITAPLAEGLLEGPMGAEEVPIDSTLAPWIRGHDHGHNLAVPETDFGWLDDLGLEPFSMLGEAYANVYGFLMLVSDPWLEIAGVTRLDMCTTHIAELLHYMRRGPQHYSDPGAAYLELSFLAANGYVEVTADGKVRWDEESLCEGMVALAKALTESTVGAPDERASAALIDAYGWPMDTPSGETPATPAGATLAALRRDLANVPTSIVFYSTSEVATGESVPVAA